MRIDRAITLLLHPIMRLLGRPAYPYAVVLMYHSISSPNSSVRHPYYEVCTTPERFDEHMRILSEEGYSVIDLSKLDYKLTEQSSRKQRTKEYKPLVAITFDDGFQDFFTQAIPILNKYKFKATTFLITNHIAENDKKRKTFKKKTCLTWEEVNIAIDMGFEFGSHSASHPKLNKIPTEDLKEEIIESQKAIERFTERACDFFSHPYAFPSHDTKYVQILTSILQQTGYKKCLTTTTKCYRKPSLLIDRIPINNFDDPKLFKAKLSGCYDWVAGIQLLKKKFSDH